MIKVSSARNESRKRDAHRNRLVLKIGNLIFHITRLEARRLHNALWKQLFHGNLP
jgi:hypothetical protein